VRRIETDIIELKALALMQGPARIGQVNSWQRNIGSDMMILFPSLCCSLTLVASLRTSIPEWNGWSRMKH